MLSEASEAELLADSPDLDVILAPVGGGGLLSGTAIAATALRPGIRVIAAEPEMADDAYRSLQAGRILPSLNPRTIADGLLASLGDLAFHAARGIWLAVTPHHPPTLCGSTVK
ncbi:MAG: pyridoxal-phosphate dependent enzyme [Caldilineales bacterium]|nr:pyridoxal-phosphate dependent enzyme [Caldilineales bacterium]MDW8318418.1 pyridoxal-phosphate dependent enzyme [Anaerolineae bacterium]